MGFAPELVPLILSGKKTTTWRLWDDKNLTEGDDVELANSLTKEPFAKARLVKVTETVMGALTEHDKHGHETFTCDEEMYKQYSSYYGKAVNADTEVKIIKFVLQS